MPDMISAVREAFARADWQCRPVAGMEVVEADFEAYHTKVCLHVQVFAELHAVSVVAEAALRRRDAQLSCAVISRPMISMIA